MNSQVKCEKEWRICAECRTPFEIHPDARRLVCADCNKVFTARLPRHRYAKNGHVYRERKA